MSDSFKDVMTSGRGVELFKEYLQMLKQESDKGAVLIASGLFEEALRELITKHLYPCLDKRDPLFSGDGSALGTFEARIEIAYRLGLLNSEMRRHLNLFRKLRNEFAHNIYKTSLTEADVKDRLAAIYSSAEVIHTPFLDIVNSSGETLTSRQKFNIFFAIQMMALKISAEVVEPL